MCEDQRVMIIHLGRGSPLSQSLSSSFLVLSHQTTNTMTGIDFNIQIPSRPGLDLEPTDPTNLEPTDLESTDPTYLEPTDLEPTVPTDAIQSGHVVSRSYQHQLMSLSSHTFICVNVPLRRLACTRAA